MRAITPLTKVTPIKNFSCLLSLNIAIMVSSAHITKLIPAPIITEIKIVFIIKKIKVCIILILQI